MKKLTFFLVALLATILAFGQVNPNAPLERDSQVKYGKLENGLTYYIRHNEKPAQRADFYLLTDVGAIEETPAQDGLAHFLEHMALNGTKNLPGKQMLEYFQSIGVSFGPNINAMTGTEQTIYLLSDIPVTRQGIIDTAMLVLHDYSGFVTNDPVEIDKERGVIVEEWRTRRTADWRAREQMFKYLFKGSKYATCTTIGTKENLETFAPTELQDFYKTWYHPGNQAVVIVGDIDVDAIEAQLKELFKDIPARENPKAKTYHKIPANDEPIVGIITDPEMNITQVAMYVKSDPMPKEYNAFGVGVMMDIIKNAIGSMFAERLQEISMQPNAPFIQASAGLVRLTNTMDALVVNAVCKDGDALKAYNAALTEIVKAQRYGFTEAEYDRAKASMLKGAQMGTANAESRVNSDFVGDYTNDFFYNRPAMTPAYYEEQLKGYLAMLPLAQINQVIAAIPLNKNAVVVYVAPEKEGLTHPTEAELANVITEVQNAEIQANAEEEAFEPFVDAAALKGSKVKKEKKGVFGSTVWTLKNGIQVYLRPSDYNKEEIRFDLIAKGGKSLLEASALPSMDDNVSALYGAMSGLSKFPQAKVQKMLAGMDLSMSTSITDLTHGIVGHSTPADFETLLQLVYLQVVEPRFVEEEFAPTLSQLSAVLPNLEKQPNFVLGREYFRALYGDNPRKRMISTEMLSEISFATFEQSFRALYSNMAGAKVILTGNFDPATIKPLIEKYIGSLPVARKQSEYVDHNLETIAGTRDHLFSIDMATPKSTCLLIAGEKIPFTLENRVMMKSLAYILNMIYTDTVREDEGGSYGVMVQGVIDNMPKDYAELTIQFDTDPEKADKLMNIVISGLEDIAANGPSQEMLTRAKENFVKSASENRIQNGYWQNALRLYYLQGIDIESGYEDVVNSLTCEKMADFAKKIVNSGNRVKVVMSPSK